MLRISNLHVAVADKEILKGVSLIIEPGKTCVLMGPNGSGKSTLAYTIMGHPEYKIKKQKPTTKNHIELNGKYIDTLKPDERAKLGLFLAFQAPVAIPGVSASSFLYIASKVTKPNLKLNILKFNKEIELMCRQIGIAKEFLKRSLNCDFSGGEKKKMEMLQLLVLKPKYAIIDEIDTGLDIDALKIVASQINKLTASGTGMLLITHYQRILKYIKAYSVHVMIDGKIIRSGGSKLASIVERRGYERLI